MSKIKSVKEIAKELSASVRWSSGYGQYENDSKEQQAYIDGVTTAIGMMYIDLTGTPKTIGLLQQDRQAFAEATMQVIDDYFKGLVAIPDPQATKESIKEAVRAIYQGNK